MNRLIAFVLIAHLSGLGVFLQAAEGQQTQPPPPRKIIIQTPFGPKEIDAPPDQQPATPATASPSEPVAPPVAAPIVAPPAADPLPAEAQPAPGAQSVPAVPQQPDPNVPIITLDNQDIHQVIRIIADTLGLNYIVDPTIKGTVNIHTTGSLRRSDLLPILETILKINGATIIQTGNFYQIVPSSSAARQPLQVEERSESIPVDDQIVMQIVRMRYVSGNDMGTLLNPYLSDGASVTVAQGGAVLIITERRSNLRKLLEIVDVFDTNAFEGDRIKLFPVRNDGAGNFVKDLETIFSAYALGEKSTAIRFVPLERLNAILAITANAAVFPEVEKWIGRLDQPTSSAGMRNFVYRVKNGKAADIQSVLSQLYGVGPVQMSSIYNTPSGSAAQGGPLDAAALPQANPFSTPAPPPQGAARAAGEQQGVRIIADQINNALVIQATPQEYAEIERTIQELDVLRRQVLIDAQIYEVVLDDSLSFGLSAVLQNRGTLAPQTGASFIGVGGNPPSLDARTFGYVGRTRELLMFLNAQENRSRVRTLSAPSVLASDNMAADFQVGAEVPVPTTSSVTPVQSGGTNLFAQTIQFRPTGVILKVRPQINDSGNVTLEISQEVSQAGTNTTSGVVAPVIGKSSVSSSIVVRDGQTIALGGFIREDSDFARSRLPLLGRIPGLGALFGNTTRSTTRTELIILITPHVLKTHEDADLATDELKSKLREVKKLLR